MIRGRDRIEVNSKRVGLVARHVEYPLLAGLRKDDNLGYPGLKDLLQGFLR